MAKLKKLDKAKARQLAFYGHSLTAIAAMLRCSRTELYRLGIKPKRTRTILASNGKPY